MTKVAPTIGSCYSKCGKTSYPLPLRVLPLSQGEKVCAFLCNVINPLLRPTAQQLSPCLRGREWMLVLCNVINPLLRPTAQQLSP